MGLITLAQETSPATPSSGTVSIYPKTDNKIYAKDSTGTEVPLSISTPISIANGGTGQITAAAARGSSGLNIDERTTVADTNYTIVATDRYVGITSITATRTLTLPAASSVNAGQILFVQDESGSVSSSVTVVIQRAGSDTINGGTSVTQTTPYARTAFISNGTNAWNTTGRLPISGGGTNSTTALNNNRVIQSSSGAIIEAAAITASRGLISDANGIPTHSTSTSTEVGFLAGSAVTNGGVIYGNGSAFRASAAGTSGQILQSAGAATPTWVTPGTYFVPTATVVATSETTTSTSYVDLTTSGPAVTVTTGTSVLLTMTASQSVNGTGQAYVGFAVSGATTVAATDVQCLEVQAASGQVQVNSAQYLVTGLTAGSNTFTCKYRVSANTGTFKNRNIIVVPT